MSESELGRALLACDAPLGNDPRQLIGRVLERDRWRVRLLAAWTLLLWLLAVVGVFLMVTLYFILLQPRLHLYMRTGGSADTRDWVIVSDVTARFIAVLATTTLLAAGPLVRLIVPVPRSIVSVGPGSPGGPALKAAVICSADRVLSYSRILSTEPCHNGSTG